MSLGSTLESMAVTLRALVAGLEPGSYGGQDALRALEGFSAVERAAATGRLVMARRVEESKVWRGEGDRTAAHFLARTTGSTVGRAVAALDTAQRLEALPATNRRCGRVS